MSPLTRGDALYGNLPTLFCYPSDSDSGSIQRLTSSLAPFIHQGKTSPLMHRDLRRLLHLLSSRVDEPDDMRGYRMVIHTFCHPEATSPMTCGGTVWLSAPFIIPRRQARWHVGVPYDYPHLSSSWGGKSDDMRGYRMVIHIFYQPGANEPIDMQRLTSSPAPFVNQGKTSSLTRRDLRYLLHLLSSRGDEPDDMRGYRMVIRTFHHPGAASPMTRGGTVWLSAPFVIPRQHARWHAGVPYGYPHLLSIRANKPIDTRR